ncbi:MAG: LysR family transcriptional regulator [Actinobacteria bacterium]|nr:LysR family transcriptional regulator [Actinomycetota bacterium]
MPSALPDLSLRQLEYLVAVSMAATWADAAASLGVTPSALSQGLAELERRVGVPLFDRDGRRRPLRASATPVLEHARRVVALTGDLASWADRMRGSSLGSIRLGLIDVAAVEHFDSVINSFRVERPEVSLSISVAPSAGLIADLRRGALDLIVCVEPGEHPPGVDVTRVLSEPIVVIAPSGTEIGPPASWGPWVLFPDGSHTRESTMEALRALGADRTVVADSHQPSVVRAMVRLGMGWGALSRSPGGDAHGLVEGPELFRRHLALMRRDQSPLDPAAIALAESIIATGNRIDQRDR